MIISTDYHKGQSRDKQGGLIWLLEDLKIVIGSYFILYVFAFIGRLDLLKGHVREQGDSQEDGRYTTAKIGDHCQNLLVLVTEWVPGYILQHGTVQNAL